MFEAVSALDSHYTPGGRVGSKGAIGVHIGVRRSGQLVQLGAYAGRSDALNAALRGAIGTALPASTTEVLRHGPHRLYRIATDQYWVLSSDAALPATLRAAISPDVGSVTSLSDARVRLTLQGSAVVPLLGRLVSVDLRPQSFAVGSFAQTGLHHVGVLLERLGPDSFELHVLRTYAASTWEWLLDAALPFGYEVLPA